MYCFQNPFSRAGRSVVSSQPLSNGHHAVGTATSTPNGKCNSNGTDQVTTIPTTKLRRPSEAVSEGSGSSSLRYIDQLSGASSTDTLPGAKGDYLEHELLSPGLPSPTIVFTSDDGQDSNAKPDSSTTPSVPQDTTTEDATETPEAVSSTEVDSNGACNGQSKAPGGRWRRKLLLRLRSVDSSSSTNSSTASPAFNNDSVLGRIAGRLSPRHSPKLRLFSSPAAPTSNTTGTIGRARASGTTGSQNDETSSLPSSPAAPSTVGLANAPGPVPYYGFLSVQQGVPGCMRQESTSTSSPQLCADDCATMPSPLTEDKRAGSTETMVAAAIKSGLGGLKPEPSGGLPVARSCPNLERQSASSASGSSSPSPSPGPLGPRFKPVEEGDIQVCYLNHTRTLVSKILSSRFLRRWETHHLYLNDACLSSKTLTGFLQQPVPYSNMTEVYAVARWDPTYKYCLRIVLPDGSLLLQASNAYTRDQWYHSILWKKSIFKYQHQMSIATKEEVVLRELKALVDFALWTPLQDERVTGAPLEAVAKLLEDPVNYEKGDENSLMNAINAGEKNGCCISQGPLIISELLIDDCSPDEDVSSSCSGGSSSLTEADEERNWAEAVLNVAAPLLERAAPPSNLARVLARLAQRHPRSRLVPALAPAVTRCLKHTVDFGKSPDMRKLLQVFVAALYEAADGEQELRDYIASVHGPGSDCPHPRILPNLVSICVAAIFYRFEVSGGNNKEKKQQFEEGAPTSLPPLRCYLLVLNIASEYADWRPGLGALLQPVPFPEEALADKEVQETVLCLVMRRLANDPRCPVHRVLLPVREGRPGWIHIAAPSSPACPDEGQLFGEM
ncbi:hypothetical protein QAD02_005003, partial [Eretmocerus hayati]